MSIVAPNGWRPRAQLSHKTRPPPRARAAALLLLLGGCAARLPPPAPAGDLVLDAASPTIAAIVGGVALRLRVDPAQWGAIELDPAAAARLAVAWESGRDLAIGRVALDGRTARTILAVAGQSLPVLVAEHGRKAADGADGVIGPDLLPFATIRWRRADAPPVGGALVLPLALSDTQGLTAIDPALPVPIRLRFTLARPESEATAAAGSLLAAHYGGAFDGPARPIAVILGVTRPARPLALARPPRLAGFRYPRLLVRIGDFRGENPLPADPVAPGEIVVTRRIPPQAARAWVTIAADRLVRCAEIVYSAAPRSLTLRCAFDR